MSNTTNNTNLDCNHSPLLGRGAGGEADRSLIIIGCGPGGYDTATYAAKKGFKVTIFEKGELGGTCLNRGCIPTKVYCHVASVLLEEKKLQALGIQSPSSPTQAASPATAPSSTQAASPTTAPSPTQAASPTTGIENAAVSCMPKLCFGPLSLSFPSLKAHKDAVVAQLKQGIETLMSAPGITLIRGEAKLKDAHTVTCTRKNEETGELTTKDYTADTIIIATGSHSAIPPIDGINNPHVVTSTGLLNMDTLPNRLAIIGAGVIGMEMASAYSAFGSEVTVIEFLKECLPPMDQDLAKRLRKLLEKRGVKFYLGASAKRIEENGNMATVFFEQKGKELSVDADTILIATGRRPNVEGLGLEEAGIAFDRHGITIDDNFETSLKGVYAIGDVNGKVMLAHAAEAQGQQVIDAIDAALKNKEEPDAALKNKEKRIKNKESGSFAEECNHKAQCSMLKAQSPMLKAQYSIPSAVFTIPELAGVGPTEAQLKAEGKTFEVHKSFYRANGKAVAMDATDGLVKVITDADGHIIACHVLGAHAADLVQEATVLIDLSATIEELRHIVHIHPTLGELMKTL